MDEEVIAELEDPEPLANRNQRREALHFYGLLELVQLLLKESRYFRQRIFRVGALVLGVVGVNVFLERSEDQVYALLLDQSFLHLIDEARDQVAADEGVKGFEHNLYLLGLCLVVREALLPGALAQDNVLALLQRG